MWAVVRLPYAFLIAAGIVVIALKYGVRSTEYREHGHAHGHGLSRRIYFNWYPVLRSSVEGFSVPRVCVPQTSENYFKGKEKKKAKRRGTKGQVSG